MGQWGYCFCPELFPGFRGRRIPIFVWSCRDPELFSNPTDPTPQLLIEGAGKWQCCFSSVISWVQEIVGVLFFLEFAWFHGQRPMHGAVMGYILGPDPFMRPWDGSFS
jgi:hypothetical protein